MSLTFSPEKPEVSLLGPGYGECVVIHLGGNAWVIVDSCIDSDTGLVASLQFLQSVGVDPVTSVRQVIASHWHDDHVRGLATTLEACPNAEFVCSGALRGREFLELVMACGRRSLMTTSGVTEFYRALRMLEDRASAGQRIRQKFAMADRCLLRGAFPCEGSEVPYEIQSLSPSDQSFRLALMEIGRLLQPEGTPKRRVSALRPNHAAVALLIRVAEQHILLGADLEEEGNPRGGWTAVLASTGRTRAKAEVYKVPHHGSVNADHPDVWLEMLTTDPYAVLTPFLLGDVVLPTKEDVRRILTQSGRAYITAQPRRRPLQRRERLVERYLEGFVRNRRRLDAPLGQVRLQASPKGGSFSWSVELKGAAIPLARAYAA